MVVTLPPQQSFIDIEPSGLWVITQLFVQVVTGVALAKSEKRQTNKIPQYFFIKLSSHYCKFLLCNMLCMFVNVYMRVFVCIFCVK